VVSPQNAIFVEGSRFHWALEYTRLPASDPGALATAARRALTQAPQSLNVVVAFGPALWKELTPARVPAGLRPFESMGEPGKAEAPATQRDVLFWIHGPAMDDVFDAALSVHRSMASVGRLDLDVPGFVYHDSRDLTGFIDGTANPRDEAARDAALVPPDAAGAGGAFVLTQQWVHDLGAFNALPVGDQEGVIGRTKSESVELQGDAMPPDSHVSRTDAKVDGVAMKIFRRSFPYGTVARHGLYFLAFACDIERFDVQLRRMYGVSGDGVHDRITEFSQAITGSYWFAPGEDDLKAALAMG
jgi:putative iron-dependent peroxidase